ncbi:DUF5050 domain-containing protein [Thalassotalea nanhaiensis]|uniref:DUF5050 domain-containing protein n=1 Tax=Thalassotalea nanhaiensis TaxID=3065648 RepID=A0ABY9TKV9_9GAMM|nr:DUF5050 domain-containing protein [Colwelliaceae bacterium SQ345]
MIHNQYMIGPCLLDCQTMSLSYQEETIKLSVKVFELLKLFLISSENIVSRQAAIESIWLGNEGVGKRGYTNAVWTLRKTFKELGLEEDDLFITLPKVGYQLSLNVEAIKLNESVDENADTALKAQLKSNSAMSKFRLVSAFALIVVLIAVFFMLKNMNDHQHADSNNTEISKPVVLTQNKVTNFEGIEEHPAVANNGQYVAFQWLRENSKGKIYIQDLKNSSTPLRLITMVDKEEASPVWSFNDESLAYIRITEKGNCQVRVRQIVTNSDSLVDDDCFYQPFKRVLTWSNANDKALTYTKRINDGVALFRYDFESKVSTQITYPLAGDVDFAPHWSADNKTLAFIREQGTQVNNILLQAEDKTIQTILKNKVGIVDLDWDLVRNEIYTNLAEDGRYAIKKISLPNLEETLITDHGLPSNISFNNRSGKLFFTNHISKEYIAQLSLDTGRIIRKISSSSRDLYGRFVAETGDIIFLSNRADNWALWLNNKQSSINLTKELGNATVPAVSPDGRKFAVNIRSFDDNERSLYIGSIETRDLHKIDTNGIYADNLSWSRDGESIYFYGSNKTNSGIYKLHLASKKIDQITNKGEHYAIESNDGKLYVSRSNKDGIWSFDLKTAEFNLVTEELAAYDYAAFFLQNGDIYYLNRDADADLLKRINSKGDTEILISYPKNSIRKFFGISSATENSFLATLKITNEADINSVTVVNTNQ